MRVPNFACVTVNSASATHLGGVDRLLRRIGCLVGGVLCVRRVALLPASAKQAEGDRVDDPCKFG